MNLLRKISIVSVVLAALYAFSVKPAVLPFIGATGFFVFVEDTIYQFVENPPRFNIQQSHEEDLHDFLSKNLVYPPEAQQKGIQGMVFVSFVVEKDGSISNATVARGIDPLCDAEALRVVNLMPEWIPGDDDGKAERVKVTLPIQFRIKYNENTQTVEEPIYECQTLERYPQFNEKPSHEQDFRQFLVKNIVYPPEAQKNGIQGTVYVSFIVEKDGSLSNADIAHSVHPLLDFVALRVVYSMPKWIPGKLDGKEVRVKFTMPIKFELRDNTFQFK